VLGDIHLNFIKNVLLEDSTVSRRIEDMSCLEHKLIKWIKIIEGFAMAVDESTDVAGLSVLLEFVRYITIELKRQCSYRPRLLPWFDVRAS
jgi:hypothetical protein